MPERFERHVRTVSGLTMVSRVTGLLRDATLSRLFGAGAAMDAFFFAFMIPNLFRRLFGEGALAAAFLPVYSRLDRDDPVVARQLARLTIGGLVIGLGLIVLVGEAVLFGLRAVDPDNLALHLMMLTLPYMPLVCIVAIVGAMLQVHGRFGPAAAAPIVLNGCVIGAAWLGLGVFDAERGNVTTAHLSLVALSLVVAGLLQIAWSFLALRSVMRSLPVGGRDAGPARQALRDVVRQALPMILGLGVLQLNTFFDGLIASYPTSVGPTIFGVEYPLDEGAMSAVSFAQRLYQFPLGVFGIAVATAIFPLLARQADEPEAFAATIQRGLRLVIFIGLPASAGLLLVREPLAAVILQGGAFDAGDSEHVGAVLMGYAPAIWSYSMVHVLTRAFLARGQAMTTVRVAAGMVLLNLILNLALIWTPLREAGLAWSTAICSVLQTVVLMAFLHRSVRFRLDRAVWTSWARTAALTAVMTGACLGVIALVPDGVGWTNAVLRLAAVVGCGLIVVLAGSLALRMPETRWLMTRS